MFCPGTKSEMSVEGESSQELIYDHVIYQGDIRPGKKSQQPCTINFL